MQSTFPNMGNGVWLSLCTSSNDQGRASRLSGQITRCGFLGCQLRYQCWNQHTLSQNPILFQHISTTQVVHRAVGPHIQSLGCWSSLTCSTNLLGNMTLLPRPRCRAQLPDQPVWPSSKGFISSWSWQWNLPKQSLSWLLSTSSSKNFTNWCSHMMKKTCSVDCGTNEDTKLVTVRVIIHRWLWSFAGMSRTDCFTNHIDDWPVVIDQIHHCYWAIDSYYCFLMRIDCGLLVGNKTQQTLLLIIVINGHWQKCWLLMFILHWLLINQLQKHQR